MIPLLPKNWKNLPSKTGIGHGTASWWDFVQFWTRNLCAKIISFAQGWRTHSFHTDHTGFQLGFTSTGQLPVINDPQGKTNEALHWASCSLRITLLSGYCQWEFLVRKWIVSQGEKTHRSEDCCENCGWGGFKEESITDGWRVSNVRFWGNLCSANWSGIWILLRRQLWNTCRSVSYSCSSHDLAVLVGRNLVTVALIKSICTCP